LNPASQWFPKERSVVSQIIDEEPAAIRKILRVTVLAFDLAQQPGTVQLPEFHSTSITDDVAMIPSGVMPRL